MHLKITLPLILALLTGCVTSSQKLEQLRIGMTRAEVVAILGQPTSISATEDGTTLLRYQLSGRYAPPLNPNAKRFADSYTIQLKDGKVTAFGRDDEFRSLKVRHE